MFQNYMRNRLGLSSPMQQDPYMQNPVMQQQNPFLQSAITGQINMQGGPQVVNQIPTNNQVPSFPKTQGMMSPQMPKRFNPMSYNPFAY